MITNQFLVSLSRALISIGVHPGEFAKEAGFPEIWLYNPTIQVDENAVIEICAQVTEDLGRSDIGILAG